MRDCGSRAVAGLIAVEFCFHVDHPEQVPSAFRHGIESFFVTVIFRNALPPGIRELVRCLNHIIGAYSHANLTSRRTYAASDCFCDVPGFL